MYEVMHHLSHLITDKHNLMQNVKGPYQLKKMDQNLISYSPVV